MYKFRKLNPDECRILFVRHGEHVNQVIVPADAEKLRRIGIALARAGVEINVMISSPEPRALRTGLEILDGANQAPRVHTKNDLGDITYTPGLDKTTIKAAAKKAGMEAEQYLLVASELSHVMDGRGSDGRNVLTNISNENLGRNVLVPSHGGSRMEVALLALLGKNNAVFRAMVAVGTQEDVQPFDRCQMAELIMRGSNGVHLHYLTDDDLELATAPTAEDASGQQT